MLLVFIGLYYVSHRSYENGKTRAREALGRELLAIAGSVAAGVDGDAFGELFRIPARLAGDETGTRAFLAAREEDPRYREMRKFLQRQIDAHRRRGLTEKNIYIFAADNSEQVRWAVMAHRNSFIGEPYPVPRAMRPLIAGKRVFAVSELYLSSASSERWISAYAAVKDSGGRTVGVVDVALEVDRVLAETYAARSQMQILYIAIVLAGLVAGLALVAFLLKLQKANLRLREEIGERRKAQAQVLHNAYYDHLTGLPNSSFLLEKLEVACQRARNDRDYGFATIYLGLDRFKKINDSFGFNIGDDLLISASHRIAECLTEGQILARASGGNFTVLIERFAAREEVIALAEHIRATLADNFQIQGHEIYVTCSVGIAFQSRGIAGATGAAGDENDIADADTYLRYAETAMNRALEAGGGRCLVFSADMHIQTVNLLKTATDLKGAIERDEFTPYYQPIVSLDSGLIAGFEALVRWEHPRRGLVPPLDFIPLAEETGLIDEIGVRIMERSLAQLSEWNRRSHRKLYMAVNFSPHQFRDRNLPRIVQDCLARHGVSRFHFKMEITESSAMEGIDNAETIFHELREIGILMSIDDFGTGYSSLASLSRMPIHTLKIDKSFLDELAQRPDDGSIIRTIVNLAHGLYLNVVAEGVETAKQLDFLHRIGCDEVQGYLLSKPLPAADIEQLGIGEPLLAR